jgi:hypothetical protein
MENSMHRKMKKHDLISAPAWLRAALDLYHLSQQPLCAKGREQGFFVDRLEHWSPLPAETSASSMVNVGCGGQAASVSGGTDSKRSSNPRLRLTVVPVERRSRAMSLAQAARILSNCSKSETEAHREHLRRDINKGLFDVELINRQKYYFDITKIPDGKRASFERSLQIGDRA